MPGLKITCNLQDLHLYSRNQGDIVTINLPFMLCHLQNHTYELKREKNLMVLNICRHCEGTLVHGCMPSII